MRSCRIYRGRGLVCVRACVYGIGKDGGVADGGLRWLRAQTRWALYEHVFPQHSAQLRCFACCIGSSTLACRLQAGVNEISGWTHRWADSKHMPLDPFLAGFKLVLIAVISPAHGILASRLNLSYRRALCAQLAWTVMSRHVPQIRAAGRNHSPIPIPLTSLTHHSPTQVSMS